MQFVVPQTTTSNSVQNYNKKCTYASKRSIIFENDRFYLSYLRFIGSGERMAGNG
jgi:hypothetical protein